MSNVQKFIKDLKQLDDLQAFAEEQFKTIQRLSKDNKQLEDKIAHLEQLLASATTTSVALTGNALSEPKDKLIAEVQLKILSESAFGRELTKEEASKVEIYSRIMAEHRKNEKKTIEINPADFDEAQLTELAQNDVNKNIN